MLLSVQMQDALVDDEIAGADQALQQLRELSQVGPPTACQPELHLLCMTSC